MQVLGTDEVSEVSEDGLERSFAVNHLAHFAIADRLIGRIERGGRVVITASLVHDPDVFCLVGQRRAYWQDPLDLANPARSQVDISAGVERGEARYCASKLLNVMHARTLAREAHHAGVVSFNPGVVPGTEIARERNLFMRLGWKYLMPVLTPILPGTRTLEEAADDLLHLLTEADLDAISGAYVDGRTVAAGSADSRDPSKIARMLGVSRTLIAEKRAQHAASAGGQPTRATG
jgi:NAD(P)-dependent dehydrogenase (short-subunit alcohol dehydrogenase family)